jgi:hypothetical protein
MLSLPPTGNSSGWGSSQLDTVWYLSFSGAAGQGQGRLRGGGAGTTAQATS